MKVNKLLQLSLLLIIFAISGFEFSCINAMYAPKMQQAQGYPAELLSPELKKKGLLIFLDEQDQNASEASPVSKTLLIALSQEACPIIASTSLLYNIIEHRSMSNTTIDKIAFQEDKWIIKQINNSLNLLLPVNYLRLLNITNDAVREYKHDVDVSISDIELQLGLKVNHMKTIKYQSIQRSFFNYIKGALLPPRYANYFI